MSLEVYRLPSVRTLPQDKSNYQLSVEVVGVSCVIGTHLSELLKIIQVFHKRYIGRTYRLHRN